MRRIEVVGNPCAGRGRGREIAERARRALEAAGCVVVVRFPESLDALRHAVDEGSRDCDAVVAVGGDGTLREVLDRLRRDVPVGVIPTGTANLVARELRIPLDPVGAARVIAVGRTRTLDLGEANGRRFLATAGAGLDGEIVHRVHAHRVGTIRKLDYVLPTWRACLAPPRARLVLSVSGAPGITAQDVIVCNTRSWGAYFSVTPGARPDDGILDWVAREPSGLTRALAWALGAFLRRPARALRYGRARALRIEATGEPVLVQVDGDPAGTTPLDVRVLPAAARLFAP